MLCLTADPQSFLPVITRRQFIVTAACYALPTMHLLCTETIIAIAVGTAFPDNQVSLGVHIDHDVSPQLSARILHRTGISLC